MSTVENPYATPQADLAPTSTSQPTYFVVAPRKFLIMVLLTMGWYLMYVLYRHWEFHRLATGARIVPALRAYFSVLFFYSLVMKIRQHVEDTAPAYQWWPRSLAIGVVLCMLVPYAFVWTAAPLTVLKIGVCIAILQASLVLQVQLAVNHMAGDPAGDGNKHLTGLNWLWLVLGVILWLLSFGSVALDPNLRG